MARMTLQEAADWVAAHPEGMEYEAARLPLAQQWAAEDPSLMAHDEFMGNDLIDRVESAKEQWEEDEFDIAEQGLAACDCQPGEPCCLRTAKVYDKDAADRKIEWPIAADGPDRLYMITKHGSAGRPSAVVVGELLDWERCKAGRANSPTLNHSRFQDDYPETITDSKVEKTVTSPFQLPALNIPFFPNELLQTIWIIQVMMRAATYENHQLPQISPTQCCDPGGTPITIVPIPHLKAEANVTGEVSVTFTLSSLPANEFKLSGTAKGEFGNQTIEYSADRTATNTEVTGDRQGPVNTPIFAFIDKINNAMKGLADESRAKPFEAEPLAPVTFATQSSLKLAFSVEVAAPTMELKGKGGSPNLELSVDAFGLTFGPKVTGTIDLLDLFLSKIPYGPDIRERLAHPGGVVSASAECSLTVEGEGLAKLEVMNALTIEIGSGDGWDAEFGKIDTRYTGELKITGTLKANARIDVRTWFFDASASAGAEVSTGWQFGGRATDNADGTVKWEELYHFQGIIVKAYANAALGTDTGNDPTKRPALTSEDGTRQSQVSTNSNVTTTTTLQEARTPDWEAVLKDPSGSATRWREIQ